MSLNSVTLIGYLGKDPESRVTNNGTTVATFSVATTEKRKGADGQWQDETEWHRCVCFGQQADFAAKYLKKGRLVCVQGRIKSNKYTDKNGVERTSFEINCDKVQPLGRGDDAAQPSGGASNARTQSTGQRQAAPPANDAGFGNFDEEIPF